jgi:hypothetical protein
MLMAAGALAVVYPLISAQAVIVLLAGCLLPEELFKARA